MARKIPTRAIHFRPALERLEARELFTVRLVPTPLDGTPRPGSLRAQLAACNDGDSVEYVPGLAGVSYLAAGQLAINKSISITGPGADRLSIDAHGASRVFTIAAGNTVTISGLFIAHGSVSS